MCAVDGCAWRWFASGSATVTWAHGLLVSSEEEPCGWPLLTLQGCQALVEGVGQVWLAEGNVSEFHAAPEALKLSGLSRAMPQGTGRAHVPWRGL